MICRRVGLLASAWNEFLLLISILRVLCRDMRFEPRAHGTTPPKYVQDNILLEGRMLFERYFGVSETRRTHALSSRTQSRGQEEDRRERAAALQPVWI